MFGKLNQSTKWQKTFELENCLKKNVSNLQFIIDVRKNTNGDQIGGIYFPVNNEKIPID